MTWNVFYHDWNGGELKLYNIFDHYSFRQNFVKATKQFKDKDSFAAELKSILMYYFWCKSEWEVIINPWCAKETKPVKVDVFWQIQNNWDVFVDYCWEHRKEVKG